MMTPEQEMRLPRYAQDELRVLRMRLREAESREARLGNREIPGVTVRRGHQDVKIALPSETLTFNGEADRSVRIIPNQREDGGIEMDLMGAYDLVVRPMAANRLTVRMLTRLSDWGN